jgi:GNAT superfamily N-acetyltransferase
MTNRNDLLAAYDSQLRRNVPTRPPEGQKFELRGPVLRVTGQYRGFVDTAQNLQVEDDELDALIREHRDFFATRGESVEWKTRAHDLPANIDERLRAAGFVAEPTETVLIAEVEHLAVEAELPDGVVLREVHARRDLERIAEMETAVWGEDFGWMADDLQSRISADPDGIVVLVAESDGRVVSAAWLVFKPGTDFAGLWGGSTLAPWRGKGIYKALVAKRATLARERGTRFLQVDASTDSEPILTRLGFEAVTTTTPYVWSPTQG